MIQMGNGWKCLFPQTSILNVPFFMFCVRFLVKIYVKSVLFGFVVWMHEQKLQGLPFPENKLDHIILPSASCWPFLPTNHGSEKKVPPSIRLKRHQFLLNHDGGGILARTAKNCRIISSSQTFHIMRTFLEGNDIIQHHHAHLHFTSRQLQENHIIHFQLAIGVLSRPRNASQQGL